MYQYETLIKKHLTDKYTVSGEELKCSCPFGEHKDENPSFNINMESGLYMCHSCQEHGNIYSFIAKVEGITNKEAYKKLNNGGETALDEYSAEKELPIEFLQNLGLYYSGDKVAINYYDENKSHIATRFRHHPKDSQRFSWKKGDQTNIYGLWKLKDFVDDYLIIAEGESDTQTLWYYDIPAVGVPGGEGFKSACQDKSIFNKFKKIYVHCDGDKTGNDFVKSVAKLLYPKEVYKITASKLGLGAKDPSDLHLLGAFSFDRLLSTQELIEVSEEELQEGNTTSKSDKQQLYEVAEDIVGTYNVKFYKENFYIYDNGVYREDDGLIEELIYKLNRELKKSQRKEILEYIKLISRVRKTKELNNYINFKNGIFDIKSKTLLDHSPDLFLLNQVNAKYIENAPYNADVDKFLDDVTSGNKARKKTILEIIGYSMTTSVELQKSFIFYGKSAENGKSTLVYIIEVLIGEENTCHVSIHELQGRFYASELTNKLLNVVAELPRNHLKSVDVFKSITTGDAMSVEQKYKDRVKIKPYAKSIFTANELPRVNDTTEGFYRRLQIILFEAKFTDEQKKDFNKRKLITPEALDYLASISVKAYIELLDSNTRNFANEEESQKVLDTYRKDNNSVLSFLNSDKVKDMFKNEQRIATTELFTQYKVWCQENLYKAKGRNNFLAEVKETQLFENKLYDGYDYFRRRLPEDGTF